MPRGVPKSKGAMRKGLSPKTFQGLNKKRMEKKSGGFGKRLKLEGGQPVPVQFLTKPDRFMEFEIHNFQEEGRWEFVPCAGDGCPLCAEESDERSSTRYRFCCNVYNLKERKVQILEGPKDLAGRIFYRFERKPVSFLKKAFELTKFPTSPVTYDVALADEATVTTKSLKPYDLEEYVREEMERYYGTSDIPSTDAIEDDEDDDEVEDDEDFDTEEVAEDSDDSDDEDEEDEDEDDDDDDDEDEDEEEEEEEEDDEDEDEEDDDDDDFDFDDDEDEKPAKKAKGKKSKKK